MRLIEAKEWFNVLIIYDKASEGYRGFDLFLKLEKKFKGDYLFENNLCSLSSFGDSELVEPMLHQADMIMVAVDSEKALTPEFKAEMERLPQGNQEHKHLLVALENQDGFTTGYLRELAERKGMDFISSVESAEYLIGTSRIGDWTEEAVAPHALDTNPLESCAQWGWDQFPNRHSAWGINE